MDMPGAVRAQPGESSGSRSEAVTADLGPQVPLRPAAGNAEKDDNVAWEHNTDALVAWLKRHDGQPSQQGSDAVERALANWIKCQRKAYKQKSLTASQVFGARATGFRASGPLRMFRSLALIHSFQFGFC